MLRARLLVDRRELSETQLAVAATGVLGTLTELLRDRTARAPAAVAAYVPVGREPGGAQLPEVLSAALPAGSRLLLPVLRADLDVDWAVYGGPDSLRPGPRGLREPAGPRLGLTAVAAADLVLVPALAVDRQGLRLGRGGGSYDRVLARVDRNATVALLHDGELVDQLPAEPHDRPVGAAVTPRDGLVRFGHPSR